VVRRKALSLFRPTSIVLAFFWMKSKPSYRLLLLAAAAKAFFKRSGGTVR
jgi:hypothetical protein